MFVTPITSRLQIQASLAQTRVNLLVRREDKASEAMVREGGPV